MLNAGEGTAGPGAYDQVSKERALEKGCLSCHEGIEDINALMTAQNVTCINCHYGNPIGTTKGDAHKGMIADPGDLHYIDQTCGQCHSAKPRYPVQPFEVRGEKGHVDRMLKGVIATAAGEISGARYVMGAQDTPTALYGVRGITDEDGTVPAEDGALSGLEPLPSAQISDADNLLRHSCLQCHLWTGGRKEPGYYRGTGCTSCHTPYDEDGLSKTGDPTISKTTPGHPVQHKIVVGIPTSQCLRCHDSGPARHIGPQFTGKLPRTSSLNGNWAKESALTYAGDLHYQRGMDCIDCHSSRTVHGDGNIYSKAEEQVAVRCETCHGNPAEYATLIDARGEKLSHIAKRGKDVFLQTKATKKIKKIPQVAQLKEAAALPPAMAIPAHVEDIEGRNRLTCQACHAQKTAQCYGCHAKRDDRRTASVDWVNADIQDKKLTGTWEGRAGHIRFDTPPLGINSRGLVTPFAPGGQMLFTRIAADGTVVALNKTSSKPQPFSFNPVQPHSTSKKARSCESCHNDPKALGLGHDGGSGIVSGAVTGPGVRELPFERFVDEQGTPLQSVARPGARFFYCRRNGSHQSLQCLPRLPQAHAVFGNVAACH